MILNMDAEYIKSCILNSMGKFVFIDVNTLAIPKKIRKIDKKKIPKPVSTL